ncbi:skin secretory protein xP2-like [Chiloscyllium plagiosum]|uniref:skin secretory protein xP2-like n=1 Tax=Chiloscyllium plagiosum TaxID=36176 RepID=UPI001CB7DCE8|nr:skin secretory protein xP2-like [Chiloscyllium plagiosum]
MQAIKARALGVYLQQIQQFMPPPGLQPPRGVCPQPSRPFMPPPGLQPPQGVCPRLNRPFVAPPCPQPPRGVCPQPSQQFVVPPCPQPPRGVCPQPSQQPVAPPCPQPPQGVCPQPSQQPMAPPCPQPRQGICPPAASQLLPLPHPEPCELPAVLISKRMGTLTAAAAAGPTDLCQLGAAAPCPDASRQPRKRVAEMATAPCPAPRQRREMATAPCPAPRQRREVTTAPCPAPRQYRERVPSDWSHLGAAAPPLKNVCPPAEEVADAPCPAPARRRERIPSDWSHLGAAAPPLKNVCPPAEEMADAPCPAPGRRRERIPSDWSHLGAAAPPLKNVCPPSEGSSPAPKRRATGGAGPCPHGRGAAGPDMGAQQQGRRQGAGGPQRPPKRGPDGARLQTPPRQIMPRPGRPLVKEDAVRRNLIGEIAFQLDRRVLTYVFTSGPRLYGFRVLNIPEKTIQVAACRGEHDQMTNRHNEIMQQLRNFGYCPNTHPKFAEQIVNTFGILKEKPQSPAMLAKYNDPEFLKQAIHENAPMNLVLDLMVLLNCLANMSANDGMPLFIW